ncbi:serine/threonine-protein kinase, partial [Nocardiopsis halotolerans]|uniref:serine/threonine-protein kinase n=1 Tax=Nocardiopsis halotolerans TaxID=124252 RepID=UPI0004775478
GPKVLDFGIARAVDGTALTRTGGLVGTPGWIAPEQYAGQEATGRSDVFAWGVMTAFAANGRNPFGSGGPDVMASRILSEPPELDGLPEGLLGLVGRALDKDPARRPDAATALRETTALLGAASGGTPDTEATRIMIGASGLAARGEDQIERWRYHAPPRRSWARRHGRGLAVGAAGLALAVLAGTGIAAFGGGEGGPGTRAESGATAGAAPGATNGGTGDAEERSSGQENAELADVPAEYRDLYATGTVTVEPVPGDGARLLRTLAPAEGGGDALDQLRLTFTSAEQQTSSVSVTVTVEYLPDFGRATLHSDDFAWVSQINPSQESLDYSRSSTRGVLAELGPQEPEAEFTLMFVTGSTTGAVYYLPSEVLDEQQRIGFGYPGGFCYASEDQSTWFADSPGLGPHDTTLTDGMPRDSCVYEDGPDRFF